jgi:hypothetical protein
MNWDLKHRAENDTRSVPIPPERVTILREHITEFGTAADGRLSRTVTGGMVCDTTHTWAVARTLALVPEQVASPLAARPYDLRHAAVSLWLNGGVTATDVANRAGHSVDVLLRVYAKCIDCGEEAANRRIDEARLVVFRIELLQLLILAFVLLQLRLGRVRAVFRQDALRLLPQALGLLPHELFLGVLGHHSCRALLWVRDRWAIPATPV